MKKKILSAFLLLLLLGGCGNNKNDVVVLTPSDELNPGEKIPLPEDLPEEVLPVDYGVTVANLSGKDLNQITLDFGNGAFGPVQILSSRLYDGELTEWKEPALAALNTPAKRKLTITAVAKDGTELSFETIAVPDLNGAGILLTREGDEYKAVLQ